MTTISLKQQDKDTQSLSLTYAQWLKFIASNNDDYYYENLTRFAHTITEDLKVYKHFVLAKNLGMSSPQLSHIKPLLEAVANGEALIAANALAMDIRNKDI